MRIFTSLLFVTALTFVNGAYASSTNKQLIKRVQYNGAAQVLYFVGDASWSSPTCPNATYVQVKSDVPGQKEIMSLGLAAKMAGKNVTFWGACDADPNYYNAFYIIIE